GAVRALEVAQHHRFADERDLAMEARHRRVVDHQIARRMGADDHALARRHEALPGVGAGGHEEHHAPHVGAVALVAARGQRRAPAVEATRADGIDARLGESGRGLVAVATAHVSPLYRSAVYSTTSLSPALRPKVSGWYISSALAGATTNVPGVVARVT